MEVRVTHGSLTDGDETVLVNASNTNLQLGSGVSHAIRVACGGGYQAQLNAVLEKRGGALEPGEVVMTDAGKHPRAKWVAHVAVMDYREGVHGSTFPTLDRVSRGTDSLWAQIEALGQDVSVAMVALGAGTGGLGLVDTIRIACVSLLALRPKRISRVTFYGYALHEFIAMAGVVSQYFPEVEAGLDPEILEMVKLHRGK